MQKFQTMNDKNVTDWLNKIRSTFPVPKRKRNKNISKRTIKKYAWDTYDNQFNLSKIMNQKSENKTFLGVSDFDDLITSEVLDRRVSAGKKTVHRQTVVLCNREHWAKWAEEFFNDKLFVQGNSSGGFIIEQLTDNYITYYVDSNTTTVRAYGDVEFCDNIIKDVEKKFDVVTSSIEWIYGGDGSSVTVPLNRDRLPVVEMYPFLKNESLNDYYDRYMESSANILLLIGPPGTGKTTFIRGLLAHTNTSAIVSYDSNILEKDSFFANFIEGGNDIMVLEDSDAFLKSRSEGNTMMHRFLNVGDGLVTTKGKKMIFSTNLPSIRDIDPALVRPGRCFDIVTFDVLSKVDAKKLAKKLGVELPVDKEEYSIAEIFHEQTNKPVERKVGFI